MGLSGSGPNDEQAQNPVNAKKGEGGQTLQCHNMFEPFFNSLKVQKSVPKADKMSTDILYHSKIMSGCHSYEEIF